MKKTGGMFFAVTAAFCAALFLKAFVFDFMIVDGDSMEPALYAGDIVVVFRLAYGIRQPFTRDGVPSNGHYLVRWKNPEAGEIAVFWTPLGALAVKRVSQVLPPEDGGALIMLGDNAAASFDSRAYGPVNPDSLTGKVLWK